MLIFCLPMIAAVMRCGGGRSAVVLRRGFRRSPPARMPEGPECAVHAESLDARFTRRWAIGRAAILSGRYAGNGSVPGRGAAPAGWDAFRAALPARVLRVQAKGKFIWWELAPPAPAEPQAGGAHPPADALLQHPDSEPLLKQDSEQLPVAALTVWSTLGMSGAWSLQRTVHSRLCLEMWNDQSDTDAGIIYGHDPTGSDAGTICIAPQGDGAATRRRDSQPSGSGEGGPASSGGGEEVVSEEGGGNAASGPGGPATRILLFYNDQRNFGTVTVCFRPADLRAKLDSLGPSWLMPLPAVSATESSPAISTSEPSPAVFATAPSPDVSAVDPSPAVSTASPPSTAPPSPPPRTLPLPVFLSVVQAQCGSGRGGAVPVAKFLMDQKKTSGIGNYLLSEILYEARIYPWATCASLTPSDWNAVHTAAARAAWESYSAQKKTQPGGGREGHAAQAAMVGGRAGDRALAAYAEGNMGMEDEAGEGGGGGDEGRAGGNGGGGHYGNSMNLEAVPAATTTPPPAEPSLSATRGTLAGLEPYFELRVYRKERAACGGLVQQDVGPHGRSVFWVPGVQVRGMFEKI